MLVNEKNKREMKYINSFGNVYRGHKKKRNNLKCRINLNGKVEVKVKVKMEVVANFIFTGNITGGVD
jgi:hypothetical protein